MKNFFGIKYWSILIMVSCVFSVLSCKKKEKADDETQSVIDNAICEQEFMQVQPTANSRAINTTGTGATVRLASTYSLAPCDTLAKISGDTGFVTNALHIDPTYEYNFGSCPNVNADGITRTGKYRIRFTGPIKKPGSKMIIKLLNYVINGTITYSCDSIIITNLSTAFSSTVPGTIPNSYSFNVKVINGVCTSTTGWTIKYSSDKTISTTTNGTHMPFDDVITVSGTSSGTNRDARNFTVNVNSIVKKGNCKWISSGTMELTPDGYKARTVDYGNGTCDDDATYTVNGQTIAFKLK